MHRARLSDLDPIRELPYRPAVKAAAKAGQMAASDQAPRLEIITCFPWGVHRRANAPSSKEPRGGTLACPALTCPFRQDLTREDTYAHIESMVPARE